jgi:ABC-type dipeptide/oligopeptide/nickel transport system ATPase component
MAVFSLMPSADMAETILTAVPESVAARKRPQALTGDVELAGLSFRYTDESPWVLEDLSLAIRPGEFLGVVGSSGCGKSTLVRLLLGLLPPSKGQIYFDNNDLAAVDLDLLRQQCGVVLQDYRMFSGSILENIAAGRDLEIDQVLAVLDTIGMGDFVKALPMGIHTIVGESTTAFSGGQVQLMALARALAGNPKLLIFDEATSALDSLSLKAVGDVIGKLPITRIMFTHRLGTLKNCDRIVVLDQGCVAQQGTFNELMQQSEFFKVLSNPEAG